MEFIVENWYVIIASMAVCVVGVMVAANFLDQPHEEQLDKVREWLLYATSMAEKELGSGTGQLKLRYVYDMFVVKFPWLAKVITFDAFSDLVDEALESMNSLLDTNKAVANYVGVEKN